MRIFYWIFKKIPGNFQENFREWFEKVLEKVWEDSRKFFRGFRAILSKIPGNFTKDFGECCQTGFQEIWISILIREIFLAFMKFCYKLLQNNGKQRINNQFYWKAFFALLFIINLPSLKSNSEVCYICFNESPLNVSYFILKALFVLKIFKLLYWLFRHEEKMAWLEIWS